MALPQTAAIEAFNEVVRMAGDDSEALGRAKWKLDNLYRKARSNNVSALGLLHAHQMLGERAEADGLADELWGRRSAMSLEQRQTFAALLSAIAQYDHALELVDDISFEGSKSALDRRQMVAAEAYLTQWHPRMFRPFAAIDPVGFEALSTALDACGLLPVMQERQTIVNAALGSLQCGALLLLNSDGDDKFTLTRDVYVPVDYRQRRDIADKLSDALDDFYQAAGVDGAAARSLLIELVLPVSARPAIAKPLLPIFA